MTPCRNFSGLLAACLGAACLLAACLVAACTQTPPARHASATLPPGFIDKARPCVLERLPPFLLQLANGRLLVPVMVNGFFTIGVVDTGSAASIVTPELARAAGVRPSRLRSTPFRSLAGIEAPPIGIASRVQFGPLAAQGAVKLRIMAFGDGNGTALGALIGQDLLDGYDYDIDLPNGSLVPYRTHNCQTIAPPWPGRYASLPLFRGAARGYSPAFLQAAAAGGIPPATSLPIVFDHGSVTAMLDTGAGGSLLSLAGARAAGVTDAQISADPSFVGSGLDGGKVTLRRHVFAHMTVGGDRLRNFPVAINPHGDPLDPFQMELGMDYIGTHHLWLSYTTNALYIAAAR